MSARRNYEVFLRGVTPGITGDAFGTVGAFRSGVWHDQLIADFPAPRDSFKNDFGILENGNVTVELVDDLVTDTSQFMLIEDATFLLLEDGTPMLLEA